MVKTLSKATRLQGKPRIPGDKSISHRGLILGALAKGQTELFDSLESEDIHSTERCLRDLGVGISKKGNCTIIDGMGGRSQNFFKTPSTVLDCGNSGTTLRLMMGVLSGKDLTVTLTGDSSLIRRPMKRVAEPLRQMGAQIGLSNTDYPPLNVKGTILNGIEYDLKIASAQVKSAILLAALSAKGVTTLTGKIHSRDHTERLLNYFGAEINTTDSSIRIEGGQELKASQVHVPGDPSAAAFWIGAASLVPGAQVEIDTISLNSTRMGFIRVLEKMGASVTLQVDSDYPEPVGKIRVSSSRLCGVKITKDEIPYLIDELPLLAVLASQSSGVMEIEGAEELRVKESDRIEAIAQGLRAMGGKIEVHQDGFRIEGPQQLSGGFVESFHDHRIAMAFSIAALVAEGQTSIRDADCVNISYPRFYETLEELTQK